MNDPPTVLLGFADERLEMKMVLNSKSTTLFVALVVAAGLSIGQATAQIRKSDREHAELSGPVRTVAYETAKLEVKSGKVQEGKRRISRTFTYDEEGRIVEMLFRSPLSGSMLKSIFSYDQNGNRIQIQFFPISGVNTPMVITKHGTLKPTDGTLRTKFEYKFDNNGNRTEEIAHLDNGGKVTTIYVYDENGRIASKSSTDEDKTSRTVYRRDQQGAIVEEKTDGSVESRESHTYECDARHNWIKRISSRTVTKKGEVRLEPFQVAYRTITYY